MPQAIVSSLIASKLKALSSEAKLGVKKNRGGRMHHLHLLSSSFTIQNPRLCPNHSLSSLHSSSPLSFTSRTPLLLSTTRHFRKKRSLQCRQSDYFQQQNITRRQPPNDSSFGGGETDFFLFISVNLSAWLPREWKHGAELVPLLVSEKT